MRKLKKLLFNEKGFSLVEVLVVVALLGMILAGILSFYLFGMRSWRDGTNQMDLQQNTRIGMEKMTRELRWAQKLTNMNELVDTEGASYVAFKVPKDELIYVFRRYGSELVMETYQEPYMGQQTGWESHVKVASHITELKFRWNDNEGLLIQITASTGGREVTLQSAIFPRNML